MTRYSLIFIIYIISFHLLHAQVKNDYDLWLRFSPISEDSVKSEYLGIAQAIYCPIGTDVILANAAKELQSAFPKMLGQTANFEASYNSETTFIIAPKDQLPKEILLQIQDAMNGIGKEGFVIKTINIQDRKILVLSAHTSVGILYGTFRLLSAMQARKSLSNVELIDAPRIQLRMLNHWDNLDRTVERGYAGFSLWNWQKLPEFIDERYIDYARANASIGINATSLTNVNANALILTPEYLLKVKALADVFRGYGIKTFLTARFSAPIEIGGLETADPLAPEVQQWWQDKADEIYSYVPDFGGFLVKANSEGQPGPQNYGRTHADGANMMAKALEPHGGNVIWRAFVYSEHNDMDRAMQAYSEFVPFDGKFMDNVLVQVKNGPIDFQPREPFHPIFGAMPKTPLMMEFQITQEYLGFSSHLVFLPKLFEETLAEDTFAKGEGSTVAKVIDGSLHGNSISGMAGVSNIGNDLNWTGHPFAQANWYGFGRLAWNPYLDSGDIAEEWLRATYSNDPKFIAPVKDMMLTSREAVVNYMNPLGLHHIFDTGHHYGPGPWVDNLSRPDWNPVYYHKATINGIGFDRTDRGSKATLQYAPEVAEKFNNVQKTPEMYLLWFHHLPWDYRLKNGQSLWDGMALKYQEGVHQVEDMIRIWNSVSAYVDKAQYNEVRMLLEIQLKEAQWWRDACLLYFQTFSKQELPAGVDKPSHSLDYYKSLKFPFAPGIRPQWD